MSKYPNEGLTSGVRADLWVALPIDHAWHELPYNPEQGYRQKLFFQRDGYDWREEPLPALTVSGRRIDHEPTGDPITMTATPATNGYTAEDKSFMLAGGHFPTAGCWEITCRYLK